MKFICLDIETTGFDPEHNSVLEIAAIKYDLEKNIDTLHTFIKYEQEIPSLIKKLTSITEDDVKDAPPLESQIKLFEEFCADLPIMGHNINFDINFLNQNGFNLTNPKLDTMPLSHMAFNEIESFSLAILCKTFNKTNLPSHRAIDDVRANIELFRTICDKLSKLPKTQQDLLITTLKNSNDNEAKAYLELFSYIFKNQNNSESDYQTQATIDSDSAPTLLAVDQNLMKNFKKNHKVLKNPNYYINTKLVIEETSNPENDFQSLIRIISKMEDQTKLHLNEINFRSDQFNHLAKFCQTDFEELSQGHWISSIETLFEYKKNNKLPYEIEIQLLDGPYLEESFLKSQELTIRSSDFETSNNTNEVTFIFYHLNKFLRESLRVPVEQNYFGLLDRFTLTQKEFSDFIFQLSKLELNKKQKDTLETFRQHTKSGYVNAMLLCDQQPILKSISYDLEVSKRKILEYLTGHKVEILKESKDKKFTIQTFSNLPNQKDPNYLSSLSENLFQALKDTSQKAVVICPSNDNIKYIYEQLCLEFEKLGIELLAQNQSGSKGLILSNLSDDTSTPQILLCTHHFLLKFHPDLHGVDKAILTKLPIGSPSHFYYKVKEQQATNSFIEITIPNTAANLEHICSHLSNNNVTNLFLLDDRMDSTGWGKNIKKILDNSIDFI